MSAKLITLPSIWKRIGAHAIDLGCIMLVSLVSFFSFVLPSSLDQNEYKALAEEVRQGELESSLFVEYRDTFAVNPVGAFSFKTLSSLTEAEQTYGDQTKKIYLLDNLHTFYTQKYSRFGGTNLSEGVFESEILNLKSETSNIASFYQNENSHYAVTLIDENKASTAVEHVLSRYKEAIDVVERSPKVKGPNDKGNRMMLFAIAMILPCLFISAFIFTFLIPLFLPNSKTLGKLALHLVVLRKDGYKLNKWWLLPRFLTYALVELIGGILSFGGTFLISYTMTMFNKKHRAIHDFAGNSIVADEKESLFFENRYEEELYEQHLKKEGISNEQEIA